MNTELHRLLERVRELECRLEDLAALVAHHLERDRT